MLAGALCCVKGAAGEPGPAGEDKRGARERKRCRRTCHQNRPARGSQPSVVEVVAMNTVALEMKVSAD